jgi:hypothetical protein
MSYEKVCHTIKDGGSEVMDKYSKTPNHLLSEQQFVGGFAYFELCIACLLLS